MNTLIADLLQDVHSTDLKIALKVLQSILLKPAKTMLPQLISISKKIRDIKPEDKQLNLLHSYLLEEIDEQLGSYVDFADELLVRDIVHSSNVWKKVGQWILNSNCDYKQFLSLNICFSDQEINRIRQIINRSTNDVMKTVTGSIIFVSKNSNAFLIDAIQTAMFGLTMIGFTNYYIQSSIMDVRYDRLTRKLLRDFGSHLLSDIQSELLKKIYSKPPKNLITNPDVIVEGNSDDEFPWIDIEEINKNKREQDFKVNAFTWCSMVTTDNIIHRIASNIDSKSNITLKSEWYTFFSNHTSIIPPDLLVHCHTILTHQAGFNIRGNWAHGVNQIQLEYCYIWHLYYCRLMVQLANWAKDNKIPKQVSKTHDFVPLVEDIARLFTFKLPSVFKFDFAEWQEYWMNVLYIFERGWYTTFLIGLMPLLEYQLRRYYTEIMKPKPITIVIDNQPIKIGWSQMTNAAAKDFTGSLKNKLISNSFKSGVCSFDILDAVYKEYRDDIMHGKLFGDSEQMQLLAKAFLMLTCCFAPTTDVQSQILQNSLREGVENSVHEAWSRHFDTKYIPGVVSLKEFITITREYKEVRTTLDRINAKLHTLPSVHHSAGDLKVNLTDLKNTLLRVEQKLEKTKAWTREVEDDFIPSLFQEEYPPQFHLENIPKLVFKMHITKNTHADTKIPEKLSQLFEHIPLVIQEVPLNEICQFSAIAMATFNDISIAKNIKREAVDWLAHRGDLNMDGKKLSTFIGPNDWASYIEEIGCDDAYGDFLTLFAVANVFNSNIVLFTDSEPQITKLQPLEETLHVIYLCLWKERYYASVQFDGHKAHLNSNRNKNDK